MIVGRLRLSKFCFNCLRTEVIFEGDCVKTMINTTSEESITCKYCGIRMIRIDNEIVEPPPQVIDSQEVKFIQTRQHDGPA